MSNREQFEEWEDAYRSWTDTHDLSVRRRMRQDMAFVKTFERGWEMRQPEIDAKDKVIGDLALQNGILKAEIGRLADGNAALKAEVERLRKDADRYQFFRDVKMKDVAESGEYFVRVVSPEQMDAVLDAAMKETK